jgi:hypothetical protein
MLAAPILSPYEDGSQHIQQANNQNSRQPLPVLEGWLGRQRSAACFSKESEGKLSNVMSENKNVEK